MINYFVPTKNNSYKPYLLRNGALAIYTTILLLSNTLLPGASIKVSASSITPDNIIKLSNEERTSRGLEILSSNHDLTAAALAKANDMIDKQYWDHFGPNGESPWQFILATEYDYVYAGENLAKGFETSEGTVQAWLASPTHRENLLSNNYKDIGVAVVQGNLKGEEVFLVVQMFGNLTGEISNIVIDSVDIPPLTENGDTSSISITSPQNGTFLNDPTINIKGETTGLDIPYTLGLKDNNTALNQEEKSTDFWELSKESDWAEGEHEVIVNIQGTDLADTVTFSIDTKPPQITEGSVTVFKDGNKWDITLFVDDINAVVDVVSGSKTFEMQKQVDGYMNLIINNRDVADSIKVIATDSLGNNSELDISDEFISEDGDVLGQFIGVAGSRDGVNTFVVGSVFVLLAVEMSVYWKQGLLAQNGGNLFTVGAWWALLLVGVINGYSGTLV